jgi:hypothetical protein
MYRVLKNLLKRSYHNLYLSVLGIKKFAFKDFKPDTMPSFESPDGNLRHCLVMCAWKRIDSIENVLDDLKKQNLKLDVFIWNNNFGEKEKLDKKVSKYDFATVFHSPKNVGGYGRFYMAKYLNTFKIYDKVFFIDDDQILPEDYLSTLYAEHQPKTVVSSWAFQILDRHDYWVRRAADPGQEVDYAATRGMIVDMDLFSVPEMFECPKRYWFIEDFWLTYVAKNNGYKVIKSATESITPDDGNDQSLNRFMTYNKSQMLRYLIKQRDFKLLYITNAVNFTA